MQVDFLKEFNFSICDSSVLVDHPLDSNHSAVELALKDTGSSRALSKELFLVNFDLPGAAGNLFTGGVLTDTF